MPVVLIILVAVLFVGIIVYGAHAKAQRRQELAAWAAGHGLRFVPDSRSDLESRYPEFDCLRHGTNRYAYNLIDGDWQGRALLGFDYHYATHSTDSKGRRRTQHHQGIQAARRFYNANVRDLNTRVEVVPSNIVAGLFGFGREEYFEIDDTGVRQPPPVALT